MGDVLCVLDLETTGSDETKDSIIEFGAILVEPESLAWLRAFDSLVTPTDEALGRLLRNDVVRKMHEENGLLKDILGMDAHVQDFHKPHAVARRFLNVLEEEIIQPQTLVLAGSGVGHFDRRFIKRWMPQLDSYFRHWCVDVGVIRRAHCLWTGTKPPYLTTERGEAISKTHRALDDCCVHLEEMRAFARLWRGES